jgi:hypothetical protein
MKLNTLIVRGFTPHVRLHRRGMTSIIGILFFAALIQPEAYARDCSMTSVGLTPISDLGSGSYLGSQGGLYPGGSNLRPASHESTGLSLAQSIEPMNANGSPDPNGKYVLLSIGMSNANQEFNVFVPDANADRDKDPDLVIVNGAQGGATATKWAIASNRVWSDAMQKLSQQGVSANQVAVVWAKLANSASGESVDQYRADLQRDVEGVVTILADQFPNLKLVYLTSRIYAGYATSSLNPEPYAYESGFVMKWVIEKQLDGELPGTPWLSWGPYAWADGLNPRSDGLTWECGDLREDDGTHPSEAGMQKVASMLLDFFRTDSTAKQWYLASPGSPSDDTVAPAPPENLVVDP